ncbi:MAG: tyrosine-type recombinase/integrase, partial [Proteobacteria bacterium]|nr:tyrosine-type recombinase/integrase [Pseudomonadota bacterium]
MKKNETLIVTANIEKEMLPSVVNKLNSEKLFDILQNYLQYYASGESHTARAKKYDLQHFLEFLAGTSENIPQVLVSEWTLQKTKDFIDYRLQLGESPATVNRRLATIKHFGRTLAERVHGYINPAREAKAPTLQVTKPKGLTSEEIDLLRAAAISVEEETNDSFLAQRNKFMLELLLATGLRADEVRQLVFGQISEDQQWFRNVKTKGKKYRNVYLDSSIRDTLNKYLEKRDEFIRSKFPEYQMLSKSVIDKFPLFVSSYEADINDPRTFSVAPKTIWRIISSFGAKAQALADKPVGNLHPHKLRHTFAHGLLDSSKDVRLVAQALGHSDVRTTMRYTE